MNDATPLTPPSAWVCCCGCKMSPRTSSMCSYDFCGTLGSRIVCWFHLKIESRSCTSRASVMWHISLTLMNSVNKTETVICCMQTMLSRHFHFVFRLMSEKQSWSYFSFFIATCDQTGLVIPCNCTYCILVHSSYMYL